STSGAARARPRPTGSSALASAPAAPADDRVANHAANHVESRSAAAAHLGAGLWNGIVATVAVLAAVATRSSAGHEVVGILLLLVVAALAYDTWWGSARAQ